MTVTVQCDLVHRFQSAWMMRYALSQDMHIKRSLETDVIENGMIRFFTFLAIVSLAQVCLNGHDTKHIVIAG